MRTKVLVGIALLFGLLQSNEPGWAQSSTSLCGLPQMRGTAAYNKYCGSRNPEGSGYDSGAVQRAQDAADAAAEAEARQRQRERELEQQRAEAVSKRRMEELANQARFLADRDAAATRLRGSTPGTTIGGSGDIGLRGSGTSTELRGLRSAMTQTPNLDPMVVDARNVPSGLPKTVDDAIATGYAAAPPGVSERVRKGFQAVRKHDWKLAKAWFEDALNHDPDNAGLKRLVELAEYTGKRTVPNNAGKSPQAARGLIQLPTDSDIQLLFPGWESARHHRSDTASRTSLELPKDSDLEYLFPGLRATEARKLNDYIFDQALKMTANDPVLIKLSNRPNPKEPRKSSQ